MDSADFVWNRALGPRTAGWRAGDIALADALQFHGMAMNGGVLNAVESTDGDELVAARSGFEWLGLGQISELINGVLASIESGALEDDDRTDALERSADQRYFELLPTDKALEVAFRAKLQADPASFSNPKVT